MDKHLFLLMSKKMCNDFIIWDGLSQALLYLNAYSSKRKFNVVGKKG